MDVIALPLFSVTFFRRKDSVGWKLGQCLFSSHRSKTWVLERPSNTHFAAYNVETHWTNIGNWLKSWTFSKYILFSFSGSHTVWKFGNFSATQIFTWNQFWLFQHIVNLVLLNRHLGFSELKIKRWSKLQFLAFWNQPKLISRKIRVAGNCYIRNFTKRVTDTSHTYVCR